MIPWLASRYSREFADLILGDELGQSLQSNEPPAKRTRDAPDENHGDGGRRPAQTAAGRSDDAGGKRPRRPAENEIGRARRPAHASGEPEEQSGAKLPGDPRGRYFV